MYLVCLSWAYALRAFFVFSCFSPRACLCSRAMSRALPRMHSSILATDAGQLRFGDRSSGRGLKRQLSSGVDSWLTRLTVTTRYIRQPILLVDSQPKALRQFTVDSLKLKCLVNWAVQPLNVSCHRADSHSHLGQVSALLRPLPPARTAQTITVAPNPKPPGTCFGLC